MLAVQSRSQTQDSHAVVSQSKRERVRSSSVLTLLGEQQLVAQHARTQETRAEALAAGFGPGPPSCCRHLGSKQAKRSFSISPSLDKSLQNVPSGRQQIMVKSPRPLGELDGNSRFLASIPAPAAVGTGE